MSRFTHVSGAVNAGSKWTFAARRGAIGRTKRSGAGVFALQDRASRRHCHFRIAATAVGCARCNEYANA